ncbi:MAG: DnaJ domain-containing protein [Desulfobacterales bacterium]
MIRDYYLILGIGRDADEEEIRQAYRRRAKRYHPDSALSDADALKFQEAREAYDTLSDREKRRRYDDLLSGKKRAHRLAAGTWTSSRQRWRPFDAGRRGGGNPFSPVPPSRRTYHPAEDLYVEIVLSEAEAASGGTYHIRLALPSLCPHCGGRRGSAFYRCATCGGRGFAYERQRFTLTLPPGLRDGQIHSFAVQPPGVPAVRIHLSMCIE